MIKNKIFKKAVAILCIALILAYASVIFLPYTHKCVGTDCVICAIIETSRNLLLGLVLSASLWQLTNFALLISNTHFYIVPVRDETPIGLKVKLSN